MEEKEQLEFVINRIREIRIRKRISQLELSTISNLSQSFLASVEKGKNSLLY
jgi:transcriptional regulator with XRE-family HTH domain